MSLITEQSGIIINSYSAEQKVSEKLRRSVMFVAEGLP